jgi:hypothetical protein
MVADSIPWLLVMGPLAVIAWFVLRAIIDPSRMARKRSGPRWRPSYIGTADSGGGIDSGVPEAASGFGDCGHEAGGGPHGDDCGGHASGSH